MSSGRFDFERTWVTPAPAGLVHEALADVQSYPQWWPQVRAVARIDDDTARVVCRSVLPYTVNLVLHAERREPTLLEVAIDGDLRGWSRAELGHAGDGTRVTYTQSVVVTHPFAGLAANAVRPIARWNHEQMMRGLQRGLERGLQRSLSAGRP